MTETSTGLTVSDVFSAIPPVETDRLLLRRLTLDDAPDIYAYAKDPEVSRYTVWDAPRDIGDTREFLRCITGDYRRGEPAPWGIVDKGTGSVIGTCGYFFWDPEHARAEVHYALSRAFAGKGLMTEAVSGVMAFGFRTMRLHRIEAKCMVDNRASERVMQKCGMRFEGIMREALYAKGTFHDLKMYAILKDEFMRLKATP